MEVKKPHRIRRMDTNKTYRTDYGFFTYRVESYNLPRLLHFYIDADKRSFKRFQEMLKMFIRVIAKEGYDSFVGCIQPEVRELEVLVRYAGGKDLCPYWDEAGSKYYLVKLREGRFRESL